MTNKILRTIYSGDKKHRVTFFDTSIGLFGFEEEYFSEEPLEMCWIPTKRQTTTLCDSLENAIKEAEGRIEWLKKNSKE